ncbi:uncharacterized protein BJ171DRAFT_515247 [Polychytrium aggregatum]|uniref:uncharacterized protein n=1 Tax=Polychytrium aggregatum TaxID=110093 RepID=UPI0022FEAD7A|nr:uncharacterized protein BJ171DRAFT_515247 [Polychytrium aggregatum]KAI9202235.1 hypothetical protein BJ171DRAFT_515247 [Polychytrium aggregatum]
MATSGYVFPQEDHDAGFYRSKAANAASPSPLPTSPSVAEAAQAPYSPTTPSIFDPTTHISGKIFVGGLNWETSDAALRSYFEAFGEVDDCAVMKDPHTGTSRGFAFLTFKDSGVVDRVLNTTHHLDGKRIDPKRAVPRSDDRGSSGPGPGPGSGSGSGGSSAHNPPTNKLFVGGVSIETSQEEFRHFFEQFGPVTEAMIMCDRETQRSRGFGFVTFEDAASTEKCLQEKDMKLQDRMIEVRRATPKGNRGNTSSGSSSGGMHSRGGPDRFSGRSSRGYGGGYGGYGGPGYRGSYGGNQSMANGYAVNYANDYSAAPAAGMSSPYWRQGSMDAAAAFYGGSGYGYGGRDMYQAGSGSVAEAYAGYAAYGAAVDSGAAAYGYGRMSFGSSAIVSPVAAGTAPYGYAAIGAVSGAMPGGGPDRAGRRRMDDQRQGPDSRPRGYHPYSR